MSTSLAKYDDACRAIAAARTVDVAKDIRSEAEAMRVYARQSKNKDLELHAVEIRLRAERRLGELIAKQKATVGLNQGAVKGKTGTKRVPVLDPRPTLEEAGIDKKLSARSQKLAAVPTKDFEHRLDEWRDTAQQQNGRVPTVLLNSTNGGQSTRRQKTAKPWDVNAAIDRVQRVVDAELVGRAPEERRQFGGLLRQMAFYLEGKKA